MLPITGYPDRYSVAPGETIAFKVSSAAEAPYEARLVRVISGDPNPEGPGMREEPVEAAFAGRYPSRVQPIHNGSWARVSATAALDTLGSFTVTAIVWPTLPRLGRRQGLVSRVDAATGAGFTLGIDAEGSVAATLGDGSTSVTVRVGKALRARAWYRVFLSYDAARGELRAGQQALEPALMVDDSGAGFRRRPPRGKRRRPRRPGVCGTRGRSALRPLQRQARSAADHRGRDGAGGRVPRRRRGPRRRGPGRRMGLLAGDPVPAHRPTPGPHAMHGETRNLPARAMKGSRWTGEEMCWRHAPEHYAAIHFHDDDLHDCGWETDFRFDVPEDFRSGVYAVRLRAGDDEDMIPFFVRATPGRAQSSACVLFPVFTYIVYANFARGNVDDAYREQVAPLAGAPVDPGRSPRVRDIHLQPSPRRQRGELFLAPAPRHQPALGLLRLRGPARRLLPATLRRRHTISSRGWTRWDTTSTSSPMKTSTRTAWTRSRPTRW